MGNLFDAVEEVESSGNPLAKSLKGAVGLMQITQPALEDYNKANATTLSMDDMMDASPNRKVGRWYLSRQVPKMLQAYGMPVTLENVLWAYNAGIGRVVKGVMPKETKDYIEKVKRQLEGKKGEGEEEVGGHLAEVLSR